MHAWCSGASLLAHRLQAEQEDSPESTYQAQFDTEEGVWKSVRLPWHAFVPVKRAQVLSAPAAATVTTSLRCTAAANRCRAITSEWLHSCIFVPGYYRFKLDGEF